MQSPITVLGGFGFVGTALCDLLVQQGHRVTRPDRTRLGDIAGCAGTMVWCIGLTAGFRTRPLDTVTAHAGLLADILSRNAFDRVVYLSSTRLYAGATVTREDSPLSVTPGNPSDLYNATKLAGEALVLTMGGVVVRLSNIIGPAEGRRDTFLGAITRQALDGRIVLESAPSTAKDYLWIDDAARGLADIVTRGRDRIYNLGSGRQIQHQTWLDALAARTGCAVTTQPGAPDLSFPPIDTTRLRREFGFAARDPVECIDAIAPIQAPLQGI